MKRAVILGSLLVGLLGLLALPARAAGPEGMRLYVFTSGSVGGFPKSALQIGAQGTVEWAPIGFFVIKHPKGTIIFDTGNNDKTITDPDGWWGPLAKGFGLKMTQNDAMDAQLPAFSANNLPAHARETGRKSSPGAGLRVGEGVKSAR